MTLHPQNLRKEIKDLMIAEQSAEFLEQEVDRLHHLIEEVSAPLAADGGYSRQGRVRCHAAAGLGKADPIVPAHDPLLSDPSPTE